MDDGTACPSSPLASAAVLGLAHAVVDLATVATVYVEVGLARLPWETVVLAIVAYDGLAFGLQLPIGLLSDRHRVYRPVMFAGLSLTLAGLCLGVSWPLTACVIAGVGNALFHVGAGALVLVLARGRATEPGLFVAPGALGLTLGIWVGTASLSCRWLVAAAVVLSAAVLARHRIGSTGAEDRPSAPAVGPVCLWRAVLALLVAAGVRSTVGDALTGRWRDTPAIVAAIVAAAVAGKAAGGVLADRIGWRLSGVLALAMLAPLAPLALTSVPAAVAGTLLSQLTMAVTLAGVCAALPGRPGVAFGLTSLALLIGAIPALTHFFARHDAELYLQPMVLVALLAIFVGLGLVPRRQDTAAVPGATGPAPTRLWK